MAQTVFFIGSSLSRSPLPAITMDIFFFFSCFQFQATNSFHMITEQVNSLISALHKTGSADALSISDLQHDQFLGITELMFSFISLNRLALRTEYQQWIFCHVTKRVRDFLILLPENERKKSYFI